MKPPLDSSFGAAEVMSWQSENFEFLEKLQDAPRNQGEVYLMRNVEEDVLVAVKRMPNHWICKSYQEFMHKFSYECECPWLDIGFTRFLNERCSKFACNLKGVYRDEEATYVVTEFCDIGDMFKWSWRLCSPSFDRETIVRPVALKILQAVRELHDLSICHLDISLENILLSSVAGSSEMLVRLIDFGQAKTHQLLCTSKHNGHGKPRYLAPEIHTEAVYDGFLADVFALGVTLYCLLVHDYPWRSTKCGECKCFGYVQRRGLRAYVSKRHLSVEPQRRVVDSLSEPLLQLLEGMLAFNPRDRLTLAEQTWQGCGRPSVWENSWLTSQ